MQLFLKILVNGEWRFAGRGADWSQGGACDADRYDLTLSTTDDIACAHLWARRGPSLEAAINWCLQEKWEVMVETKKSHWTDAFFKHVDALGNELRKAQENRK